MIHLYTHGTPNGHKISIALEEMGIPYTTHIVEVFQGEGRSPDFLAMSPAGKIPAIHDDDTGHSIYESNAILYYLADKSGMLAPRGSNEALEARSLLFLQASLQGPMFGQRAHFSVFAPETIPYGIKRYDEQGRTIDELCDRLLNRRDFFLKSGYSIVDVSFFAWYLAAQRTGAFPEGHANLDKWFARVNERAAVRAGIAAAPPIPLPARKTL